MLGIRHLEAMLLFAGLSIAFTMRVNMSLAIVAMMDPTATKSDVPTFPEWSIQIKDTILSSFFWGYVVMQIPAGLITERFGGKRLLAASMAVNVAVTMLTPLAAISSGWQAVCACRVVQGLAQAAVFPAMHGLQAKWVPISERSRLTTCIYIGAQIGTILELITAGFLAESRLGWPAIFYSTGIAGAVWTIAWLFMAADSPRQHKWISVEEVEYIESSYVECKKITTTPWKAILTSVPFWALLITHFGHNWGFYTLLTEMPSYMKNVLGVDIKDNGLLSALPYLAMVIFSQVVSFVSDYTVNNEKLSRTAARKIANTIAYWGPAIFLIGLSYTPSGNVVTAVALLTCTVGINGAHLAGFMINHIDLSPNFAATLMGITNMVSNTITIGAPLSVGLIVKDESDASEWRVIFFISAAIYFVTNICFIAFGDAEIQSWNEIENLSTKKEIVDENCQY